MAHLVLGSCEERTPRCVRVDIGAEVDCQGFFEQHIERKKQEGVRALEGPKMVPIKPDTHPEPDLNNALGEDPHNEM